MDPQALYELWERQPWAAHAVELRADRRAWAELPQGLRERLLWHMAAFFVGEERVAVQISPLVAAAETAAEGAFLASQQVDEARHAQFFDRFYAEVAGVGGTLEDRLGAARDQTGAALAELLDGRLDAAAARLRDDPGGAAAKVDFVTIYHMVIEGTLALTGQRMLLEFLDRRGLLAGLREGLRLIARDEHRHVAYGAWYLRERTADPAVATRVTAQLQELIPLATGVLVPPGARPERFRPLDWSGDRISREALDGLTRRLAAIGIAPSASASAARAAPVAALSG
jgi:ribonucleoside-diphosphate reductase beta chain